MKVHGIVLKSGEHPPCRLQLQAEFHIQIDHFFFILKDFSYNNYYWVKSSKIFKKNWIERHTNNLIGPKRLACWHHESAKFAWKQVLVNTLAELNMLVVLNSIVTAQQCCYWICLFDLYNQSFLLNTSCAGTEKSCNTPSYIYRS